MFKAFYWMFLSEQMKKTFWYNNRQLIKICGILFLICFLLSMSVHFNPNEIYKITVALLALITFLLPFILLYGYFWELTDNIIDRKTEIISSDIYSGKVHTIENIIIPEINIRKFVWRGISAYVSMLILGLVVFSIFAAVVLIQDPNAIRGAYLFSIILYFLSFGMFWNYAKRNSVFATLNIGAGVHLLGTYPGKYLWNWLLGAVFATINALISAVPYTLLGINNIASFDNISCLKLVLYSMFSAIQFIYTLYVGAYLIGTLAPNSDY